MNAQIAFKVGGSFLPLACSLLLLLGNRSLSAVDLPSIQSIRLEETNVVVSVEVPDGIRRVTLECRTRLGRGTWTPRAVARPQTGVRHLTFRLPRSADLEVMRVRADATELLPANLYTGPASFPGVPDDTGGGLSPGIDGTVFANSGSPGPTQTEFSRTVVESDIWMIRDQTLYYFNSYRGLQVIDITQPDTATVRGTLPLPAAGEQLYLLGTRHVVLLARDSCGVSESAVILVEDTGAAPRVVASLPVPGVIQESRLVGRSLYVASQTYRQTDTGTNATWEWGTQVSSFDLSDAAAPVARNTLWYPGYGSVVSSTDRLFFVVTQNPSAWWQSIIRTVDITAPDGTMADYETITPSGQVKDKFKINYAGSVLTTISEDGQTPGQLVTRLETFRLPDPRSAGPAGPAKLGQLEVGRGERLRATRFDGDTVYVVTFMQIDPLFVVSIADPTHPRLLGELQIPGWSTYIEPLGDRLVAVGVETNHVAVSLFDVADPARPALLSRVLLGDNYSFSEANWDEKAFNVLPEHGLILVPFSGYSGSGFASSVQLIDLERNRLQARGVIPHELPPRRATVYDQRILSVSGRQYLSVDATDRDHPQVRGELMLAWSVDRVFLNGDYLVELSLGGDSAGGPVLRVVEAAAPEHVLREHVLTNLSVQGITQRNNRLYVLQAIRRFWYVPLAVDGTNTTDLPKPGTLLTVLDLSGLPALTVLGQTFAPSETDLWSNGDRQAVWPREDLLVWVSAQPYPWRYRGPFLGGEPIAPTVLFWPGPYWLSNEGHLLAFDVADAGAPKFVSEVTLNGSEDGWRSFSRAYVAEGRVYLSHQRSEFFPGYPYPIPLSPIDPLAPIVKPVIGLTPPVPIGGGWMQQSFLDVIDYADPELPVIRTPVNLPGQLQGVSHNGEVVYTLGRQWTTNYSELHQELSALSYDGVAAHLIDSINLSNEFWPPVLVVNGQVFLGRTGLAATAPADAGPRAALETWVLSAAGRLERVGQIELAATATALAEFPGLIAVQEIDQSIELLDRTQPSALDRVGGSRSLGCTFPRLDYGDGALERGLWLPLGVNGVAAIPVTP